MMLGRFARAAIVLAVSAAPGMAAAQGGDRPAAGGTGLNIPADVQIVGEAAPAFPIAMTIVNGEVIFDRDVDSRLSLAIAPINFPLAPDELVRVRAQVLRTMIDETLQTQEARTQEIPIDWRGIETIFQRIARNAGRTPEQLSAYLTSIGSSEASLKRQIEAALAALHIQRRATDPPVGGEEEIEAVAASVGASNATTEYRVFEIFMSSTPETAAAVQDNAARMVEQLRAGASFPAYARRFSEATTASQGGDLGWVRAEQLPDALGALIRRMPVGAYSDPTPLPGGISIIALGDARHILAGEPRDAILSVRQLSLNLPAGAAAQAQAGARLASLTRGGCGNAPEAARSSGAELADGQLRVRELPPVLRQHMLDLNVGWASPPFRSQERLSVLILCGRDDPAPTEPDAGGDPQPIDAQRRNLRAQRYLRDLRRDAVIEYRPEEDW